MKILALERECDGSGAKRFEKYARAEARRVWELYQSGHIREMFFRSDQRYAVLILECRDADEANEILSTLPLVKNRLIYFESIPLVPYPGFERLFRE